MANKDIARTVFNDTSGKLHFMLTSIFGSEELSKETMKQIYTEVFATSEAPSEEDIYRKSAEICFNKLGKPNGVNSTEFPVEDMLTFFKSCENFDKPISNESIADLDVLNSQTDSLDPVSKLTVLLRMYIGMPLNEIAKAAGTDENSVTICLFTAYRSIMPGAAQVCSSIPSLTGQPVLQLIRISLCKQGFNTATPENIFDGLFNEAEPIIAPSPIVEPIAVAEPVIAPSPIVEPIAVAEPIIAPSPIVEPIAVAEPAIAPSPIVEPIAVAEPAIAPSPIVEPIAVAEPVIAPSPIVEPIAAAEPVIAPSPAVNNIYSNVNTQIDLDSPEWSYVKNKFGFDVSADNNAKLSEAYSLIAKGYTEQARQILFSINREAPHAASFLGLLMIEVSAVTPDDMMNISADYASLPLFNAADYYANSQLKDFLGKLLNKYTPPAPPVITTPDINYGPVAEYEPPKEKEKKKKTGLAIGIIIVVALLAIAGVIAYAFSNGLITLPDFGFNSKEESSEVNESEKYNKITSPSEETSTEQQSIVHIDIGTSTLTIDRAKENKFEFRPTQDGYYVFVSEENTLDLEGNLFSGNDKIASDHDSGNGNNFMVSTYCSAFTPLTLTVTEKAKGNGNAEIKVTIYQLDESVGKAYVTYSQLCTNGITVTASDTLYLDHTFDSTQATISKETHVNPVDFYIDKEEGILWVALPGASQENGDTINLWYAKRYSDN